MRLWQLLILMIIISSCKNSENCKNENYIIRPSKKDVTLSLNYNQNQENLIEDVEELFDEDICWEEKIVGLKIGNKKLKTIFQYTCLDDIIRCTPINSEVKILMNQKGETLLNSQIIQIDSIEKWIGENFPNGNNFEKKEIFFLWAKESPKEKIEEAFEQITKGYLKSYGKIAKNKYGKELCELEIDKIRELNDFLKFRIKLGFGKIWIPPPPPPNENEKRTMSNM